MSVGLHVDPEDRRCQNCRTEIEGVWFKVFCDRKCKEEFYKAAYRLGVEAKLKQNRSDGGGDGVG